ncbi:hypothetical protein [Methylorubrum aminovorans]
MTRHVLVTRVLREIRHFDGMRAAASYFRQKAELCRELAKALAPQHDPVVSKLHEMADEFDDNARILERRIAREEAEEDVSSGAGNVH